MSDLKIRERGIMYRGPETLGSPQRVTEYQIVSGRKIISRHETEAQAKRALDELTQHHPINDEQGNHGPNDNPR